jgi:glycosyltransferase involved in cell wall biosynthesis
MIKNISKYFLKVVTLKKFISSIRSIQNQNISDIEIILVNDFSNDNTSEIINELQKVDQRIQIIDNKKNMGTLYSRCIGVLSSKGKYIFSLDNDDMYFGCDIFDYIYQIIIEGNFDIIGFKSVIANKNNFTIIKENPKSHHPINLTLYQPELSRFPMNKESLYNDIHIWAKCIRNKIYKNGINALGKERYSKFINWAEDISMVFILFNLAHSFKFVHKYGVIHFSSNSSSSSVATTKHKIFCEIFLLDVIYSFSKNNTDKNLAVYYALNIKKTRNLKEFKKEKFYFYLIRNILIKIVKNKYIEQINKEKIINNFKDFLF